MNDTPFRVLSLCSGIGAIDYACIMAGMHIVGQVEIDPFCQKVLVKQFPNVSRMTNIKEVVGDEFGTIDMVIGGVPCQPFSIAGDKRGTDDHRHLWPYAFAIVKVAKPTWVIIENVSNFINMALDLVQADLEGEGYETQAYVLPACGIGAPHKQERTFIVAHSNNARCTDTRNISSLAVSRWEESRRNTSTSGVRRSSESVAVGVFHTNGKRCQELDVATSSYTMGLDTRTIDTRRTNGQSQSRLGRDSYGTPNRMDRPQFPSTPNKPQYEWEPPRTITGKQPDRNNRLKALGNAVVPQQIYPILKAIMDIENSVEVSA